MQHIEYAGKDWTVDREGLAEVMLAQFDANLQASVQAGDLTSAEAARSYREFENSAAFRQAIDAAAMRCVQFLAHGVH